MRTRTVWIVLVAGLLAWVLLSFTAFYMYHTRRMTRRIGPIAPYLTRRTHCDLPTELIRPAFKYMTGQELPPNADGLRAIFSGGREPSIFVKLQTDCDGITHILNTFDRPGVWSGVYDADYLKKPEVADTDRAKLARASVVSELAAALRWQTELGVSLYDRSSIKSARVLDSAPARTRPAYQIVIDDEHGMVYILAWAN